MISAVAVDAGVDRHRANQVVGVRARSSPGLEIARPAHDDELGRLAAQRALGLQARVAIGSRNDPAEHEAERVARAVTSGSAAAVTQTHVPALQRCDEYGECGPCREDRLRLQRSATGEAPTEVPRSVEAVLRTSGEPLDAGSRALFESRFGADFSDVRVHRDGIAGRSAEDVGAIAYTVGTHIAFGLGRYVPTSATGQELIAHELTHVTQQRSSQNVPNILRRACGPAVGTVETCVGMTSEPVGERFKFAVGCDDLSPGEEDRLRAFAATISSEEVTIHGFASEEGPGALNENLSCARAEKARLVMTSAGIPGTQIQSLYMHGATTGPRPERRSVVIEVTAAESRITTPSPPSGPLCGPDVTPQVEGAVAKTKSSFAGWTSGARDDACNALTSLSTGWYAWDIDQLHNNKWILLYRPPCATRAAVPHCGSSVQVGSDCHFAGSANYVIFGVMCKLCFDHFTAAGSPHAAEFTESAALDWVTKYKTTYGLVTPPANFLPALGWTLAGHRGWPRAATPAGDRSNCQPSCPIGYSGPGFTIHWVPFGWF